MDQKSYRILLLEDTATDYELIAAHLRQSFSDCDLTRAEDRDEFISSLRESPPDIVLSDYGLPSYTGLAAYADMRLAGFDLPFILVTGSLPDELAVDCLKAGIDDYILKDRLSRLPEAIQGALGKRHLERERQHTMRQLLKSQRNLAAAERLAQLGNWEWDVKSGRVLWSDQLFMLLGLRKEITEPSREALLAAIHPADRPTIINTLELLMAGEQPDAVARVRIITPEGDQKMVSGLFATNRDNSTARSLKVFGTMQDVTEQYLAEQALVSLTEELEQRVKERTAELQEANAKLGQRNVEMTESLRYAQMIQQAFLSDLTTFRQAFPSSFVLWMPKDIVSGDFYWHHHAGDLSYVAAVDCTGHGVPGALMSAVGHQLLDRIVRGSGISEPEDILRELDNGIVETLRQQEGYKMQDGMDIALCRIDRGVRQLCFAGALRPLFLYHGGKVSEVDGTRAAVGSSLVSRSHKLFFQTSVKCEPGDVAYLTSDGFYSQFGGPHGKKMLKRRFKETLMEIGHLPLKEQKLRLSDCLRQWQGEEEQVDDVLVIGIQF